MLKLSVLDQSTAATQVKESQSIRDTIELAQLCEQLGYHRFWVSEHHNHPTIVGSAPEILMAAIAQATKTIRVGSAGVMLPHYSPLKVAEQFRVLEAIAPKRIDLGLGRAPGTDGKTAFALNPHANNNAEDFPSNIRDLIAWVTNQELIQGHPFEGIRAQPIGSDSPDIWMLGTSAYGAQIAAHFGLPYCFAHFITDGYGTKEALDIYRKHFRPSDKYPAPVAIVCVWALAANTQADALKLFSSRAWWKIRRDQGILSPIMDPREINKKKFTPAEQFKHDELQQISIFGTTEEVSINLHKLAKDYEIDEIVILTWTHDENARRESYKLLSEAFNLAKKPLK